MGACSTIDITRDDALKEIYNHLEQASDEEIADVLYELVGYKRLYNFRIVSDYPESEVDPENEWHQGYNYKERGPLS